jgi:uncharacterized protein
MRPMMNQRWTRWGAPREKEMAKDVVNAEPQAPLLATITPAIPGLQRRSFARAAFAGKWAGFLPGRTISGCIPYDKVIQTIDGYGEVLKTGAFTESLKVDDPRALAYFNPDMVIGRKSAGTVQFREDRDALRFGIDTPETSFGNDLLISMRLGNVDEVAVLFHIMEFEWGEIDGRRTRNVTRARLYVVSITAFDGLQTVQADAAQALAQARRAGIQEGMDRARRAEQARAAERLMARSNARQKAGELAPGLARDYLGGTR